MDDGIDFDDDGMGGRARARTTRFSGDYSKFAVPEDADLDAFEDEDTANHKAVSLRGKPGVGEGGSRRSSSGSKGRRLKECSGCGEMVATSAKVCSVCDYQFTARSISQLNASLQQGALDESEGIRDMFPFEPEREEDGSLLITNILGRRPLAKRAFQSEWYKPSGAIAGLSAMEGRYEHEYLVKFKGLSYRHVQWLSASDIEAMNVKARQALLRYLNKLDKGDPTAAEEADVDPSFLEVEKILDCRTAEVTEAVKEQRPPGDGDAALSDDAEEAEEEALAYRGAGKKATKRAVNATAAAAAEEARVDVPRAQVFRAAERCKHVLERMSTDHYSEYFLEDVDLESYPDYLDTVDRPMSLGAVRLKLEAGEYTKSGKHRDFANDMRLIFSNCKRYNVYKSHIWHAAHTLSLLLERLYQAWVTSFQDGTVAFEEPAAQPWEPSCRGCLGVDDWENMIMCDHCDAYYHVYCLLPKLKVVPDGAWMCQRCKAFFEKHATTPGVNQRVKVYSAMAEEEARQHCECAGVMRFVSTVKKKYLVKWRGLPYRESTWESSESISDDNKVAEYHRLNDDIPDEPAWSAAEIITELARGFKNPPATKNPHLLHDLEANVHAQTRAYHFLRFGMAPPAALLRESGPAAHCWSTAGTRAQSALPNTLAGRIEELEAAVGGADTAWRDPVRDEVAAHLSTAIHNVARGLQPEMHEPYPARARLPPRDEGPASEVEVCVRKGSAALGIRVAMFRGYPIVVSFCSSADNKKFHIESTRRVKPGDIIVAVDGVYVHEMPYAGVLALLKSDQRPFMYLRLLRCPAAVGRNLRVRQAYFSEIRRVPESVRAAPPRSTFFGVFPCAAGWRAEAYDAELNHIDAGSFGDEESAARAYDAAARALNRTHRLNFDDSRGGALTSEAAALGRVVQAERALSSSRAQDRQSLFAERGDDDLLSLDSQDSDSGDDEGHECDGSSTKKIRTADDGHYQKIMRAVVETRLAPEVADWEQHVLQVGYGRGLKKKRWEQIDLVSGRVISVWDNIASAARHVGVSSNSLYSCLSGRTDNAGGFRWALQEDPLASRRHEDSKKDREERPDGWQSRLHSKSGEYKSGGALRDYQVDGLNWLLRCWYNRKCSILADEMGLGKTVQVVTFLDHLFTVEALKGHFLVCVPLSTIEHWRRECESWSHMTVCVYHDVGGGKDMRDIVREYEWYYKGRSRRLLKFHVLITTYDDLIRDYEELAEIPWRVVVVDEAHRLKGASSKLADCVKTVLARGAAHGYQHRLLMTGTPLQNNTSELFQLLNFIEPTKFADLGRFTSKFGDIRTQEQVEALQKRIAPHLLRRVKEDVAKDIPPKEETIIDVELTTMQKQYYRAIFERNHGFLMQSLKSSGMPKLMNIQMELRKCCNHPFLINGVEISEMDAAEGRLLSDLASGGGGSSSSSSKEFQRRRIEEALIPSSGKMVLVDKLLPKLRKEGHKVLIFSQMVKMIDIIEEYCDFRKYPCERLDGRVSGNDRQKSIDRFNKDPQSFVFLLSTRAGGVGINLTAADTVIIFDSDWNPQNDLQAMARCHRIGQSKNVTIYRLITRKSFEAEMFARASKKLGLEQALLGSRQFDAAGEEDNVEGAKRDKMDAKELEQLLREGAYSVLLEDGDADAVEFYQQDIDSILAQRAHTVVSEGGQQTEGWLNKKKSLSKSRVNKSKFTGDSSMLHAEIDVNDPDFWKKVLPDMVTPDMMLARLSDECNDEEGSKKFFNDLRQVMDSMLELHRKAQLPDRERNICLRLLLSITLREDDFEDVARFQAHEWLTILEGTRARKNRQELPYPRSKKKAANSIFVRVPGKKGRPSKVFLDDNGEPIAKPAKRQPGEGDGADDLRKRGRPKAPKGQEEGEEEGTPKKKGRKKAAEV